MQENTGRRSRKTINYMKLN